MAETKNSEESTLQTKRKPDLILEEEEKNPEKMQKTGICEGIEEKGEEAAEDGEDDEGDYEDEEDEEDEEDGEDDEVLNGETVVDRKGKGALMDNKGKGKMIVQDEDEDDDDDSDDDLSDGLSQSDGASDLSDDPLAEVDLNNILPTRTRRRAAQPGLSIAGDGARDQRE